MATTPYFLWDPLASSTAASEFDVAGFGSGARETALAAMTAAAETALVTPELGAAAVARPRLRRHSSGSGKQHHQQQAGGGGAKKPPQRGLGVAELERLRCGGDPLRELVAAGDAGAQGHPLLHYHHHLPASAFEAATSARFCSPLPAPAPPPAAAPACYLHQPAAGGQRAPPLAPEHQYFRDWCGRMGGFSPAGNGAGTDHQPQLLSAPLAPEHPSSQSTIWRPAAPSSSSCLHTGYRCDLCSRRTRALAERGALPPTPPASPATGANTNTNTNTMTDYSIYDLAAAMAAARQGEAFLARERKLGAAAADAPAKEEVREIDFFPASSAHHAACGGGGPDESEFAAPLSSSYGAAAASRAAPQLDLSLRL